MASTSATPDIVELKFDTGGKMNLRRLTSKRGQAYWALVSTKADGELYLHSVGKDVSENVIGTRLPKTVTVHGVVLKLTEDTTENGAKRVKGAGKAVIPSVGQKHLDVRITQVKGGYNAKVVLNGHDCEYVPSAKAAPKAAKVKPSRFSDET